MSNSLELGVEKERNIPDLNELALSNQRAGGANPIALLNPT